MAILPAGMANIAEKITVLLAQRGIQKRDLARALGISPQTATDICKGRSAITIPHLRRLIEFFDLRADYWLDDARELPTSADARIPDLNEKMYTLTRTGLLYTEDPSGLFERMRAIVSQHQAEYLERFGDATPEERRLLGLPAPGQGSVGRVSS